jgi:hypothetical protein
MLSGEPPRQTRDRMHGTRRPSVWRRSRRVRSPGHGSRTARQRNGWQPRGVLRPGNRLFQNGHSPVKPLSQRCGRIDVDDGVGQRRGERAVTVVTARNESCAVV